MPEEPSFSGKLLHIGCPNIGDRKSLLTRINDILDRRWLTNNGHYVQEFESRIADLLGVKHCVAICNATVGLEIAVRALNLTGEVIVPSFTFIASAHSLQWQQITPVFCDIDPVTHNIDPNRIEALITPHTTAIMGVHLWGRGCDVKALAEIAARRGLKLLFDASHAFGCSHGGKMIGGFGDAEIFSFHATKFINSLEGGMVTTNDDKLANTVRLMKNFGFTGFDCVEYIGTNGKMNEISAAMGLTNLESMDEFITTNRDHYELYHQELAGIPGLSLIDYDINERCNFQYMVVDIDADTLGITRNAMVEYLNQHGIIARRYFYPGCHRMQPYLRSMPDAGLHLPETERLSERLFCLPTGTAISANDVRTVSRLIRNALPLQR